MNKNLLLVLLLLGGCEKPLKIDTPAPTPPFDERQALSLLYQDRENLSWRENPPNESGEPPAALYLGEDRFVSSVAQLPLKTTQTLLFVYAESSPENNCHQCDVDMGAAVFSVVDGAWRLQYAKDLGPHGIYGSIPPERLSLVDIGPKRQALQYEGAPAMLTLLRNGVTFYEISPSFTDLFSALLVEDDSVHCTEDPAAVDEYTQRCFSYKGELRFVPGQNRDYYDIAIEYTGTRAEGDQQLPFNETHRYTFQGGQYRADK